MEDHRLRAFCLVIEMKSFSKAADAKFMTQSAMSHLVKNLEEELGVKLINRQAKNVSPTPAGRLLYEHARRILGAYEEMERDLFLFLKEVKGPLSIGASATAATYLLPRVLYGFCRSYPEVRIDLAVANTEKILKDLEEGVIGVGITEGNVRNSTAILEEIAEDEIVLIASDESPMARKGTVQPEDLLSEQFIMPETGSGTREFINDFLGERGIDPQSVKIAMTLGNPELIVQTVQAGMGISFVSKWSVFGAIKDGSVKILNIPGKKLRRKFYLVTGGASPTMASKAFMDFIREYKFFVPF
jgi:DNA-binding transcriptional LysR family regulator